MTHLVCITRTICLVLMLVVGDRVDALSAGTILDITIKKTDGIRMKFLISITPFYPMTGGAG